MIKQFLWFLLFCFILFGYFNPNYDLFYIPCKYIEESTKTICLIEKISYNKTEVFNNKFVEKTIYNYNITPIGTNDKYNIILPYEKYKTGLHTCYWNKINIPTLITMPCLTIFELLIGTIALMVIFLIFAATCPRLY